MLQMQFFVKTVGKFSVQRKLYNILQLFTTIFLHFIAMGGKFLHFVAMGSEFLHFIAMGGKFL
jgi:hypothetical protein